MALPEVIKRALDSKGIHYEVLESDSPVSFYLDAKKFGIPLEKLVRATVIESHGQQRLLILRAGDLLDFSSLNTIYGNSVTIASNYKSDIAGCDPESRVPIPKLQRLEIVADKAILDADVVYFDAGVRGGFVRILGDDFKRLHVDSTIGEFSCPSEKLYKVNYQEHILLNQMKNFHNLGFRDS